MKKQVVIIEDDRNILKVLELSLKSAGYEVIAASDGAEGLNLIKEKVPNLVILDWDLPGLSGIDISRYLKSNSATAEIPIMMVTVFSEQSNKLCAFQNGVSDYLTKPFDLQEVILRAQSLMKHSPIGLRSEMISYKNIELNVTAHSVKVNGKPVHLRPKEFKLLWLLLSRKETVVGLKDIKNHLWDDPISTDDSAVQNYIAHLREKLGHRAAASIQNIHGVGYQITSRNPERN